MDVGDWDEMLVKQAKRAGRKIPDRIANAPDLPLGLVFYFDAFCELSSDRQIGFGLGPIPFISILAYAKHYELDDDEESDLIFYVRSLDNEYLRRERDKMDREKAKK